MSLPRDFAPYAPTKNVMGVIERFRTMELPDAVSAPALRSAGVPEGNYSRVLQALEFLDLIDEDGQPNDRFRRLTNAPEPEFAGALFDVVTNGYQDVMPFVDPAQDDPGKVRGQFQRFTPKSQTGQMTSLFLGLCAAAGVAVKKPAPRASGNDARERPQEARRRRPPPAGEAPKEAEATPPPPAPQDVRLHKLVAGMLDELPRLDAGEHWTDEQIEEWLADLGVVLRRVYKVRRN